MMANNKIVNNRDAADRKAPFDFKKYTIVLILLGLIVISSLATPYFLTVENLTNVLRQVSIIGLIAFGETMLIIAGLVDLSPGSVVALTGCIAVGTFIATQSILLACVVALAVGCIVGLINGVIVTRYNVPTFITTLAMMTVARGAVFIYTGGFPIYDIGAISVLGKGDLLGIPIPVVVLLCFLVLSWLLLSKTRYGRYLYAIGGNEDAAIAAGIHTKRIKLIAYMVCGTFSAASGVLLMARLNSGQPSAGLMYEFDAITTAVIGGTSFTGGVGTMWGTFIGALIVGVIKNVMNLLNVQPYYQQVLKGIIIVAAVVFDLRTKRTGTKTKTAAR